MLNHVSYGNNARIGKKLAALLLMLFILICSFQVSASTVENTLDEKSEIIQTMFQNINNGEWGKYALTYAPSVRAERLAFVSDTQNLQDHVGILALNTVNVLDISLVEDYPAFRIYYELEDFFESKDTYRCYVVTVDETTHQESPFYPNGIAKHLVILVKENGQWWVGKTAILPEAGTKGSKYGFVNYAACPSTITMKDELGTISTVTFSDYLFNVTCNEIGNMNYSATAFNANVMAVKMIGWWAALKHCYSEEGCDLKYGIVAYKSYNAASSTGQLQVSQAITAVSNYYMVSSAATGGKIFMGAYAAGGYNNNYQSSGRLRQNGSSYLADNGYSWPNILHFYYDNSSYNNPDVGVVQIKCISHTYGAYVSNDTGHFRTCTFCGYVEMEAHSLGDYLSNTSAHWKTCSTCGYQANYGAHVYGSSYNSDALRHWQTCTVCSHETSHILHNWIDAGLYDYCSVCSRMRYHAQVQ